MITIDIILTMFIIKIFYAKITKNILLILKNSMCFYYKKYYLCRLK